MKKYWIYIFICSLMACTYTERITDGKTAYERKQYAVAIPMLEKEFKKAKEVNDKAEKAYMLAESYRNTNQTQSAADWYRKAQDNRYGKDTDLKYARMLLQLEEYDEAKSAFRNAGRYAGDVKMYREQMYACDAAKKWKKNADQSRYQVTSIESNNEAMDFSPIVYDKNKIIISSDRAESEGKEDYKWTGKKFFDLYTVDVENNITERFEADFNRDFHQGALAFNADKTEVFFTQCGSEEKIAVDYCKIMYSRKNSEGWSAPEEIMLGNQEQNYVHPVLSDDGNLMIFASNNAEGFGGYDLYYSLRLEGDDSKWSTPLNMGSAINTKGNDVFPFLDKDTLYFSSDGHPGMGGMDIFKTSKKGERWQGPENLKAPINSGGDDFGFVIDNLTENTDTTIQQMGYLTSNREGGKGGDDIYKFVKLMPVPDTTTSVMDTPQIVLQINLDGLVKEKTFAQANNPNSAVTGSKPLLGASVQVSSKDTAFTIGSDVDGTFYITLKFDTDYDFKATKPGYFTQTASISTKDIVLTEANPDTTLRVEMILDKIFTNQEIVLENIYYDLDKSFIREDAKPTLDSLIGILKRNPQIRIQLSSHTDCQGTNGYNEKLSQRRAEAAVQYLIQNEIAPARLVAKGYGENKLAVACKCNDCTKEQHQKNRRTTFLVLDD